MSSQSVAAQIQPQKVTAPELTRMKRRGQLIAVLTAYDATFARLFDEAGADVLLVGDSLGMVVQGHENTLSVTLDQMIYHTRLVARGVRRAMVVGDMPFGSFQVGPEDAVRSAIRLVKEAGAHAVKLEGGRLVADSIRRIVAAQISRHGTRRTHAAIGEPHGRLPGPGPWG